MKLYEYRLVNLKIFKDEEIVFEGSSEELPEDFKDIDTKSVKLENGQVVVEI